MYAFCKKVFELYINSDLIFCHVAVGDKKIKITTTIVETMVCPINKKIDKLIQNTLNYQSSDICFACGGCCNA